MIMKEDNKGKENDQTYAGIINCRPSESSENEEEDEASDNEPEVLDGELNFVMVKIKAKLRVHKTHGLEYLVQWGGRDKHKRPYKDSWEPASGLPGLV